MTLQALRGQTAIVGVGTLGCGEAHGYTEMELFVLDGTPAPGKTTEALEAALREQLAEARVGEEQDALEDHDGCGLDAPGLLGAAVPGAERVAVAQAAPGLHQMAALVVRHNRRAVARQQLADAIAAGVERYFAGRAPGKVAKETKKLRQLQELLRSIA